jgi:hypothetical protein
MHLMGGEGRNAAAAAAAAKCREEEHQTWDEEFNRLAMELEPGP